jgi:ABC-type nickel/cobalt efflux system permease component RcnA
MKRHVLLPLLASWACAAFAHPMGNFSVSHYSRIELNAGGASLRYVLDLAEVPAAELLRQWNLDPASPLPELERRAAGQAVEWGRSLKLEVDGRAVAPVFDRASTALGSGANGMPTLRITSDFRLDAAGGTLRFEDRNYPDRAGWKEIVIVGAERATPGQPDRSRELTSYPQDSLVSPPQDVQASATWRASATGESAGAAQSDYLSRLLRHGEITWGMMLAGMVVAFGLGAVHALSPGHGKTIVAAYLVGTRGTPKHAIFLGGMVTFTHTISVFFLGLTTLFLSQYVLPEKIYPVLGAISGLSIVWIGATLFFKRLRAASGRTPAHHHHDHNHDHHHHGGALVHDHGDGHYHSHVPEGDVSMASLIALGASGGLVPCPSALVLLLSSVALGRVAIGLALLVAFSAGLAMVLMAIGLIVLYAKHLLPDREKAARSPWFRYLPVASAGVITCAGLLMTGVALGVIRPFAGV